MDTENPQGTARRQASAEIGVIVSISGANAIVRLTTSLHSSASQAKGSPYIGTLLTVDTGYTKVLCLISAMTLPPDTEQANQVEHGSAEVELIGELTKNSEGRFASFRRGVSISPRLGDSVEQATKDELEVAYNLSHAGAVQIGAIHQDRSIPAVIDVDEMLGKHFAILGSTGTGKSCTTAVILRQVLSRHPNAHIVLLDPHNEYGKCFGSAAEVVRMADISLPFWFLNFEEIVETLIGDAQKHESEVEILRDIMPIAKRQYLNSLNQRGGATLQKRKGKSDRITVDVPTPYRISDILRLINEHMGRLEVQKDLEPFKRLKSKIESTSQDPRYSFMFGSLTVQDNLADVLKRLFRIPVAGKPLTVIQLMGIPSEIVNVLVSVLARLAFDIAVWTEGRVPITFVCEEAHRYVPRDTNSGFEPTKRALSRIAKEGRKYGASLGVVSQRPGDLDPAILSQCSTLFTMRLSNDSDQAIVRSALSDSAESLLNFLPSLGARETIVFGEGVTLPSRIVLLELPKDALPKGNTARFEDAWTEDVGDDGLLDSIVDRWRTSRTPVDSTEPEEKQPDPRYVADIMPDTTAEQQAVRRPAQHGAVAPSIAKVQNGGAPTLRRRQFSQS